jgi:hypothetical protein
MNNSQNIIIEDEPFSIIQVFDNFKAFGIKILNQWKVVVLFMLLGAITGFSIAFLVPTTFTAKTTFVVEDAKSNGSSLLSSLAGQTGIDIAGLGGNSGMLSGDNVLQILKSNTLIKKSLLSPYDSTHNLADVYANANNLKTKWLVNPKINKQINFKGNLTRLEDSLLQVIINSIIEKDISISRIDKKVSIFELNITSKDEKFSYLFSDNLLRKTTDFYIDIKVGNIRKNIQRLQERADSLLVLLDQKTYKAAEASSQLLNANKAMPNLSSNAEIEIRNKTIQNAVYNSLIQNLELSKTALLQQTPVFQNLDTPEYPLKLNKASKLLYLLIGLFIGLLFGALAVFIKPTHIVK